MTDTSRPLRADARRNRARVLEAAELVLARDGMTASLREVARQAGVGLATIYRQFPTKEALYEAIVIERVRRLVDEARALAAAQDAAAAFFGFFTRVVADSTDKKMLVDALADAGVNVKTHMGDLQRDMVNAIETLLTRAQHAGTVRDDLAMPELLALLAAACLAAERNHWDERMRTRALAFMFDGFRPR
ncbi:TetR family transcriptional regulator [Planotetraspora silvatica]|uniref:TetR family transcriptional regulator n=1 Tax=Planotetraspora silvatica TaxID=234614 RepID=A0A8J3UWY9_9ACTN|nr:helix-turn-helix domain-containing protein [Planotetraspora silvatica]GII50986.1 TetR family transcriptional regulator [Planotetraspora silvatica]